MVLQHPGDTSGNATDSADSRARAGNQKQTTICIHVLIPAKIAGRLKRFAPTLAHAGYRVSVIDVDHENSHVRELEQAGIQIRHISLPRWTQPFYKSLSKIPWLIFKVTRIALGILAVVRTPADIYHADDITALPACYLAARLRRKPLVYESHELPLVDQRTTKLPIIHAVSVWLLRRMLPYCSSVIMVSPLLVEEMHRRYGGPHAAVIRNMPKYQVAPASDRLRQELGLDATTRIALYQGYVQPNRRLDILVQAARYLAPDTVIVVMGDGPSKPAIQRLVAQEGLEDRVKLLPLVPYTELLNWTASADLGLILYPPDTSPNVHYCLPNKLFEYLMAGTPVLASPLPAIVDVLREYGVGQVVESLDPVALGEAINSTLADKDALTRMRANALAAARDTLNWEVESQRLVSLYEEVERSSRGHKSARPSQIKTGHAVHSAHRA